MEPIPTFDFIIVGGGTAGCLLAHRLSHSAAVPTVLLLEAGVSPTGPYLSAPGHRYSAALNRPDLDHGYTSEPEPSLNGRVNPYARGKGLGGSSNINFGVYLHGSPEDYDLWASLVNDDDWAWESVCQSFHAIEKYELNGKDPHAFSHLADRTSASSGGSGRLTVGLPPLLEAPVASQMEALLAEGEKLCLDPNSDTGDPVGISLFPCTYGSEGRSTSAIAHLSDLPGNLEVWTSATGKSLTFEGDRVVGVQTADGRKAISKNEVVLCAGAIDTPRLLLNGIGPKAELEAVGIRVKKDLPGVGKHLQDHVGAFMCVEVDGSLNDRTTFETNGKLQQEAQEMWDQTRTGALTMQHNTLFGGFLKIPDLENTPEFKDLSRADQEFLSRSAVPHYEFINNALLWPPGSSITPGNSYMTFIAIQMNPHSEGSVTLRSKNPADKPVLNLNYLSHPFDVLIMREAVRRTWKMVVESPVIKPYIRKTLAGPSSLSDADIDAFCRQQISPAWHANGTLKMAKEADGGSVDSSGKVHGIHGLRIADLSLCPITTNNHTQATAYLVGQKISEKMVKEYTLDKDQAGK